MNDELASRLSSLLSDPQALAGVMNLVSGMMNPQSANPPSETRQSSAFSPDIPSFAQNSPNPQSAFPSGSALLGGLPSLSGSDDRRCELLRSLKPYLRRERSEKIDVLIRALSLSGLIGSSFPRSRHD